MIHRFVKESNISSILQIIPDCLENGLDLTQPTSFNFLKSQVTTFIHLEIVLMGVLYLILYLSTLSFATIPVRSIFQVPFHQIMMVETKYLNPYTKIVMQP